MKKILLVALSLIGCAKSNAASQQAPTATPAVEHSLEYTQALGEATVDTTADPKTIEATFDQGYTAGVKDGKLTEVYTHQVLEVLVCIRTLTALALPDKRDNASMKKFVNACMAAVNVREIPGRSHADVYGSAGRLKVAQQSRILVPVWDKAYKVGLDEQVSTQQQRDQTSLNACASAMKAVKAVRPPDFCPTIIDNIKHGK